MYKFRAIVLVWALEGLEKEEAQISVFSTAIENQKIVRSLLSAYRKLFWEAIPMCFTYIIASLLLIAKYINGKI